MRRDEHTASKYVVDRIVDEFLCVVADVQRGHAGDGGAAGVGPQHLHVVPLPVRGAVPRVVRIRAGRRRVAVRARVPRRRHALPAPRTYLLSSLNQS